MSICKKYKSFVLFITICLTLILRIHTVNGEDFEIPHKFNPGEVISADRLNEIFSYIEATKKNISMPDIIGEWQCKKIIAGDTYPGMINHYSVADNEGLWHYVDVPLAFSDDKDGTYSWSSTGINAFSIGGINPRDVCNGSGKVSLYLNEFAITYTTCDNSYTGVQGYKISVMSPTRIELIPLPHSSTSVTRLMCNNLKTPPSIPTDLVAIVAGRNVTLTWTDKGENETGFKIFRRDKIDTDYKEIAMVNANVTSYVDDSISLDGKYWYRIKSVNSNGESLGSNVVKVEIENN